MKIVHLKAFENVKSIKGIRTHVSMIVAYLGTLTTIPTGWWKLQKNLIIYMFHNWNWL